MIELLKLIRIVGFKHMLRLKRASELSGNINRGFFATRTINTLFNIGFFDEFAENKEVNIDSFSMEKNLDTRILRLLCDYLYSLKLLEKEGSNYSLSYKGKLLTEIGRGAFDGIYAYEDVFYYLEPLLKMEKKYGRDIIRKSEFVAKGSGELAKLLPFPMVIDIVRKGNFKRILDLGCGDATFLISLCKSDPALKGYGVDISPQVIANGQKKLKENNLENRVSLFEGDIFEIEKMANQLEDTDVATSFFVLHEFLSEGSEKVMEFLVEFRGIFKDVPLIISEITRQTPEELRKKPTLILEHHLFHDLSNQGEITREEWKEVFKKADFHSIKEEYVDFAKMGIYTIC